MGISITFTVDDNFSEEDLKLVTAYKEMAIAIWDVKQYLRDIVKYDHFVDKKISANDAASQIKDAIYELFSELPEIS